MKLLLFFLFTRLAIVTSKSTQVRVEATFKCELKKQFRMLVALREQDLFIIDKTLNKTNWMDFSSGSSIVMYGMDDQDAGSDFEFYLEIFHNCFKNDASQIDRTNLFKTLETKRMCKIGDDFCSYKVTTELPLQE